METMAEPHIASRKIILQYTAVPRPVKVQRVHLPRVNKVKVLRVVQNPLLWALVTWLTVCAVLVLDIVHR